MDAFLACLMLVALCGFLLFGFPVAFTLAGTALLFALLGTAFGVFDLVLLEAFPQRMFGTITNETLVAIPLFILMGVILQRARIADDLLDTMSDVLARVPAGLAVSATLVGALLAASTGIVGATVMTLGLLALPIMLKRGYAPEFCAGSVAAAGTLGQIIPPSIVLILLGDVISNAYQKSQLTRGIYTPDTVSVGDVFAGALLPGLMIAGLYILYQITRAVITPDIVPARTPTDAKPVSWHRLTHALFTPLALIIAVLGSILAGAATPSEAAAVGAAGATLIAGAREPDGRRTVFAAALSLVALLCILGISEPRLTLAQPVSSLVLSLVAVVLSATIGFGIIMSLIRLHRASVLAPIAQTTTRMTTMVFTILLCAALFSLVFRGLEGDVLIRDALHDLPGGAIGALILVMLVMFFLGFVLDFIEITLVVVPIVAPVLLSMGYDPVWLAVMMAVNLQTSFMTPPFGFALFYLRNVAPDSVPTSAIYKGVIPFIILQIFALVLLAFVPGLATWLPTQVFD